MKIIIIAPLLVFASMTIGLNYGRVNREKEVRPVENEELFDHLFL